ncbi:MAG: hypothetical protein AB4352_11980 [Hormoscilla sp.]
MEIGGSENNYELRTTNYELLTPVVPSNHKYSTQTGDAIAPGSGETNLREE